MGTFYTCKTREAGRTICHQATEEPATIPYHAWKEGQTYYDSRGREAVNGTGQVGRAYSCLHHAVPGGLKTGNSQSRQAGDRHEHNYCHHAFFWAGDSDRQVSGWWQAAYPTGQTWQHNTGHSWAGRQGRHLELGRSLPVPAACSPTQAWKTCSCYLHGVEGGKEKLPSMPACQWLPPATPGRAATRQGMAEPPGRVEETWSNCVSCLTSHLKAPKPTANYQTRQAGGGGGGRRWAGALEPAPTAYPELYL